jgi:nucleoporin POM152
MEYNFIMDLQEGERAEVVVMFVGEAPFTWTYVRTEGVNHKERHNKYSKRPKVLEKRTVEGIMENRYTFMTSSEGKIEPSESIEFWIGLRTPIMDGKDLQCCAFYTCCLVVATASPRRWS